MANALAQAEAELAAELAAADDASDLGPYLGDPERRRPVRQGRRLSARRWSKTSSAPTNRRRSPPRFARLLAAGHDRDEAVALIGAALMVELNEIMRSEREFDPARYARNLANLPALPDLD